MRRWSQYFDENQTPYYFNEETGETTWDKPPEIDQEEDLRYQPSPHGTPEAIPPNRGITVGEQRFINEKLEGPRTRGYAGWVEVAETNLKDSKRRYKHRLLKIGAYRLFFISRSRLSFFFSS